MGLLGPMRNQSHYEGRPDERPNAKNSIKEHHELINNNLNNNAKTIH